MNFVLTDDQQGLPQELRQIFTTVFRPQLLHQWGNIFITIAQIFECRLQVLLNRQWQRADFCAICCLHMLM